MKKMMKKKHMNIITMTTIMTRKTNMSIIIMTTMTITTIMTSMNIIIITIIMTMTMIMKAEKLRNTESAPSFTIVASLLTWVSSMIS